ncbi:MAG TPA: type II secretion system protein GspK [Methylococcus sp.]|nr:type II secretion system protein GspK [Methylococcus sp.]
MERSGERRERGLALVLVLWVLVLMTIMAGSFSLTLRRESELASGVRGNARARALAEGGVHYAMLMLAERDSARRWKSDGTPYTVELGQARLFIRIEDESGKLDLNAASEAALRELFLQVLGDPELAQRLADAILDWRDADDLRRLHGAERVEYQAAGRPGPGNREFLVPDELLGVFGMTPAIYGRIEPLITIYTHADGVNLSKAGPAMLRILFRGDEGAVADFLARRDTVTGPPALRAGQAPGPIPLSSSRSDNVYSVRVETVTVEGDRAGIRAVLNRQQRPQSLPFSVLQWKIASFSDLEAGYY